MEDIDGFRIYNFGFNISANLGYINSKSTKKENPKLNIRNLFAPIIIQAKRYGIVKAHIYITVIKVVICSIFYVAKAHVNAQFWSSKKHNIGRSQESEFTVAEILKVILAADAKLRKDAYFISKHVVVP
jgi:hypothetical protein